MLQRASTAVYMGPREQRRYLTAPDQCQHRAILRIVVRNGFTHDLAHLLLDDMIRVLSRLERQTSPAGDAESTAFAHGSGSRRT